MKRYPFKIRDHAALRYLERVRGLDLATLKREIAEQVSADGEKIVDGTCGVRRGGFRYVIENDVVVTVTAIATPNQHKRLKRRSR